MAGKGWKVWALQQCISAAPSGLVLPAEAISTTDAARTNASEQPVQKRVTKKACEILRCDEAIRRTPT
jgi:hypothetical protein